MVTIGSLWLAILLSGVLVWIASAVIWMALPHHKSDYRGLPDEDAAVQALRPQNLAPGQYDIPHVTSMAQIKEPEVVKRFDEGPVGFMTILPSGVPAMGRNMALSVLYFLVVGFMVAYVTGRTVGPGAEYLQVFRVSGTVGWLAYGWGVVPDAIWFGRPWSGVLKHLVDALIYGLLTAGVFGWLWPG
jgi:hypothetical protein